MINELPTRFGAISVLALLMVIAAGRFWFLQKSLESGNGVAGRRNLAEPDYTIQRFRYTSTAENGQPDYHVEGEKLSHYPEQDHVEVDHLRVTVFSPTRPPMTIRSDSAKINSARTELHLYDNVLLNRPAPNNSNELVVSSDYMLVLTEQNIVKTDHPVKATEGNTILEGNGMVADSSKQTLTLQGQVNAIFMVPK
ncbi:MAG: LPS export ABC transporter periplasmic protein LptC [Burkholderiaceae bacterium]